MSSPPPSDSSAFHISKNVGCLCPPTMHCGSIIWSLHHCRTQQSEVNRWSRGHRHQILPERLNVESDMPNRAKIKETVTKEASIIALILHNSLLIHQKMQYKYISNAVVVMFFVEVCECQFGCILQKNMTVKFVYIHSLEIICGLPTFFFRK